MPATPCAMLMIAPSNCERSAKVNKTPVQAGEVRIGKRVVSERQTIDVPVEREEVVIERRPASGRAAEGDIREEEVVVPVRR